MPRAVNTPPETAAEEDLNVNDLNAMSAAEDAEAATNEHNAADMAAEQRDDPRTPTSTQEASRICRQRHDNLLPSESRAQRQAQRLRPAEAVAATGIASSSRQTPQVFGPALHRIPKGSS